MLVAQITRFTTLRIRYTVLVTRRTQGYRGEISVVWMLRFAIYSWFKRHETERANTRILFSPFVFFPRSVQSSGQLRPPSISFFEKKEIRKFIVEKELSFEEENFPTGFIPNILISYNSVEHVECNSTGCLDIFWKIILWKKCSILIFLDGRMKIDFIEKLSQKKSKKKRYFNQFPKLTFLYPLSFSNQLI